MRKEMGIFLNVQRLVPSVYEKGTHRTEYISYLYNNYFTTQSINICRCKFEVCKHVTFTFTWFVTWLQRSVYEDYIVEWIRMGLILSLLWMNEFNCTEWHAYITDGDISPTMITFSLKLNCESCLPKYARNFSHYICETECIWVPSSCVEGNCDSNDTWEVKMVFMITVFWAVHIPTDSK